MLLKSFYLFYLFLVLVKRCQIQALCYDKSKFPMTLQQSTQADMGYFRAITGDSTHLYIGGNEKADNLIYYQGADHARTVIVKIDQAKASWVWRRFYTDIYNRMKDISGVALNPAGSLLAVYAHSNDKKDGFVFVVDTTNGGIASTPAKIEHDDKKFIVRSAGIKMNSSNQVFLAFDSQDTDQNKLPSGYASRLRVGLYNAGTSQMEYLTQQRTYFGRSASFAFDHNGDPILGGSGEDRHTNNNNKDNWYLSFTRLTATGSTHSQIYMTAENGDSEVRDEKIAPLIDHLFQDSANGWKYLFGSTRSADHSDWGQYVGFFSVRYTGMLGMPSGDPLYCKLHQNEIKEAYVSAIHPTLSPSGSTLRMHAIIYTEYKDAYYMPFDFQSSGTRIPMYRIKSMVYDFESFFIVGSTLQQIGQSSGQGYQAYTAGWTNYFEYAPSSDSHNFPQDSSFVFSTRDNSATDCQVTDDNQIDVEIEWTSSAIHSPDQGTISFEDLIAQSIVTVTYTATDYTSEYLYSYQTPYDMSMCNSGNPTINTLAAGLYTEGDICYDGSTQVSKSFTAPTITDPLGCTDVLWEYYPRLDVTSQNSPLPTSPFFVFDSSQSTFTVRQMSGVYPEFPPFGQYLVNIMAAELSGKEIQAFQVTLLTHCCAAGVTSVTAPTITSSHSYTLGEPKASYTVPEFTASHSCCPVTTYSFLISPTPPVGVFLQADLANHRLLEWQSSDISAVGPLTDSPFTVTVTAQLGATSCPGSQTSSVSYTVTFVDPCLTATISVHNSGPTQQTSPIYSYSVATPLHQLSWPVSDVTCIPSFCGTFTYDLFDITLGTEDDPSIVNVVSFDFTVDPQTIDIYTTDLAKAATYSFRYKVALQLYPTVISQTDFTIDIVDPCLITTITLKNTTPIKGANPIVQYTVTDPLQQISWPTTDIVSTAPPVCGSITYELWDFSDGATEVDLTIENVVTFDFSTTPQTVSVQTSDRSKARIYNLRFKAYLTAYTSVLAIQDFDINVFDPCTTATVSLDPSNILLTSSNPIKTQFVNYPSTSIQWPANDVTTTINAAYGSLVYELTCDNSSGSLADPSIENVIIGNFASTPHSVAIQTNDMLMAKTYNMVFRVYIDNCPTVIQDYSFDILVEAYCVPTSVSVPGNAPTALSYTINRTAETANFDPFTVVPNPCNLSYQIDTIAPAQANPVMISLDSQTRTLTVSQLTVFHGGNHLTGTYVPGVYTVTIKAMADNSFDPSVSFDITVTVVDPCELPTGNLTIDPTILSSNLLIYTILEPQIQENLSVSKVTESETIATCPPIVFDVLDSANQAMSTYTQFDFDSNTNKFTVLQSNDLSLVSATPHDLKINVKYQSTVHPYSISGTLNFQVRFDSPCESPISLSQPSQTDPPNYGFKNAYTGAIPKTSFTMNPIQVDPSICTVIYFCDSNTGPRTDLCSYQNGVQTVTTFDSVTGNYQLESVEYDPLASNSPPGIQPGTYVFTISGTTGNKSTSINFRLIIEDPCLTHGSLTIDKHLFDQSMNMANMTPISVDYFLRDPKIDYSWNIGTIASETAISYDCGALDVKIFMNDGLETPFDTTIFADTRGTGLTQSTFSVQYNQILSIVGSYELNYKVFLVRNPSILIRPSTSLTVNIIDPCAVPNLTLTPPSSLFDQQYYLTTAAVNYQVDAWVTNKAWCAITYTFSVDNSGVNPVISFNNDPAQRVFTFNYSADLSPSGSTFVDYVVSVSATSATLTETKTFTLKVLNPCSNSSFNAFSAPSSLAQINYKIGMEQQEFTLQILGALIYPSNSLCGTASYKLKFVTFTDGSQPSTSQTCDLSSTPISYDPGLIVTDEKITLYTLETTLVGQHNLEIRPYLTNYPTIQSTPAQIYQPLDFSICKTSEIILPSFEDVTIKFGDKATSVTYEPFVAKGSEICNYFWTDHALLKDDGVVAPQDYITLDTDLRQITFFARKNPDEVQEVFNIVLFARYTDGTTTGATESFKLTVDKKLDDSFTISNTKPYFTKAVPVIYKMIVPASGEQSSGRVIALGQIEDMENDTVLVDVSCQGCGASIQANQLFDKSSNEIKIPPNFPFGNYTITLKLTDDNSSGAETNEYSMKLEVMQESIEQTFQIDVNQDEEQSKFKGKEYQPPTLAIKDINLRGKMHVIFDQQLILPRNLTEFDEKVIDLTLIKAASDFDVEESDEDQIEKFAFTWTLSSFSKSEMFIQIDFKNPPFISQNMIRDLMKLKVLDAAYFQSEVSRLLILEETEVQHFIPPQLNNNVATQALEAGIKSAEGGANTALTVNLATNVIFSGALNLFWGLINCLQIIAFFPLINIRMPANCIIMYRVIIKIATFELINVEEQVDAFEKFFGILEGNQESLNNAFDQMGFESKDPIQNLQIMFFLIIFLALIPLFLKIVGLLFFCSSRVQGWIQYLEKQLYWNFYIRSILELYLECTIACLIKMRSLNFQTQAQVVVSTISIVLLCTLLLFMIGSFVFLKLNKKSILDKKFVEKFGEFTQGLHPRNKDARMYAVIFMLRRAAFGLIVVNLFDYNYFQIQLTVFKTSLIMIFIGYVKPLALPSQNAKEILNETLTLLSTYALFLFSEFVPNPETRYTNGWGLIFVTLSIVLINIVILVVNTLLEMKSNTRKKYYKARYNKLVEKKKKDEERSQALISLSNEAQKNDIFRQNCWNDFAQSPSPRKNPSLRMDKQEVINTDLKLLETYDPDQAMKAPYISHEPQPEAKNRFLTYNKYTHNLMDDTDPLSVPVKALKTKRKGGLKKVKVLVNQSQMGRFEDKHKNYLDISKKTSMENDFGASHSPYHFKDSPDKLQEIREQDLQKQIDQIENSVKNLQVFRDNNETAMSDYTEPIGLSRLYNRPKPTSLDLYSQDDKINGREQLIEFDP